VLSLNHRLFEASPTLRVRDVLLSATDDLQTHREKLARVVLDEMYQFVGLLDADGMTLEINRSALEGAGVRLEDIQGRPFWEARWWAVSGETEDLQRALVKRARAGEFVRRDIEIYGDAAGEETIIIDFSMAPVRDNDGKIVFLLPEGRNITEKKRAEAEIARKNEELQRALDRIRDLDRLKSDFFANISHELRTPLALILGPAEAILASGTNLTDLQRRDLGVVRRNATTLLRHVNDLLDLARLDAGRQTVDYARVDVAQRVRAVAAHFDALAPQRGLAWAVIAPETLDAEVDPNKLDRILLNLLSNAFKFTPTGGRIRCALEPVGSDRMLLTVQDSGPGVKPELRSVIFERFRQAQTGTTREFGGTGLGLAIVKDFADLHGGSIVLSDAPGGGAMFQLELPRRAPEGVFIRATEPTPAAASSAPDVPAADEDTDDCVPPVIPGRPRVLIVEDNDQMRGFITQVLAADFNVIPAANGEVALAYALAEPPDLVVTDLMMPKMGGDRLVAEMRTRPVLADIPVVVLSAKADEELRVKLLQESVQDYLVKPFSAHELRARVRNQVEIKLMRDALREELASRSTDVAELSLQLRETRLALQRTLQAQMEAARLWRAVFDSSDVGIGLLDVDGRFLETNPRLQAMTGYGQQELSQLVLPDISPEEDRHSVMTCIAELREGRRADWQLDQRYLRSDGNSGWAHLRVSILPELGSAPRMLVGILADITARKRAEEEQKKLASLVENSSDFIGLARPDGKVLFVNPAGRTMVGIDSEDMRHTTVLDYIAETERARMRDLILPQVVRDGQWKGEILFRNFRTNAPIPMWQHIFFVTEGDTSPRVALATISRDLTERRKAAEKMEMAQAQLMHMARVSTMGELAAAIAHEVNQPLAAVVNNANACMRWLGGDEPNLEEARAAAARIAAEGWRASEVLGRIRRLIKREPARTEELDLTEVVRQALELVRPHVLRHAIVLRTELGYSLPAIVGDSVQLQQVLLNLLMNAIEATADDLREEREVTVFCGVKTAGEVTVEVRDTGVGIDPAQMDQLFAPFYTTKARGMGMGLSISRSIIEAHGGHLGASPNVGPGATFYFSVPAPP
jgi:PAS domain S-box-containing protein